MSQNPNESMLNEIPNLTLIELRVLLRSRKQGGKRVSEVCGGKVEHASGLFMLGVASWKHALLCLALLKPSVCRSYQQSSIIHQLGSCQ